MAGKHLLKGWANAQTLVALSSGESELYATRRAESEGMGIQPIVKDLGIELQDEVWGDASAALGIINRRGLGYTRHIGTGCLWVQQTAAEKALKFGKVLARGDPASLYKKISRLGKDEAPQGANLHRLRRWQGFHSPGAA